MRSARLLGHSLLAAALAAAALVVLDAPAVAADPADQALQRLDHDADGALTIRGNGSGDLGFVGVPAKTDLDNPAVSASTSVTAAADAHLARYGAAFGTTTSGSRLTRTGVERSVAGTGDVVRYQQRVDGVPVLGGEVVMSLASDRELSSILAQTSDATSVTEATVGEAAAVATARAAFAKRYGPGASTVESDGRWLLDAGLIGGDAAQPDRTVWRIHVSRGGALRRQVLVDDRTGGVVMDTDEIERADRVVCDDNEVRQASDVPCTSGFARVEGGATSGVNDVNTAYDLSGVVSDFYQQVGGVDLTDLLGISVGGVKKLASTVRWCYTGAGNACPYGNAFWNGSQMYYGTGYAGADDVVGHEMTHGFTERNSGLFYWGQSGAMNESISDIIGEIIDHRNPSTGDSPTNWSLGEDIPGFPAGIRNMQDPTSFGDPDKTSSTHYLKEGNTYPDNDGVHTNSGVGNHTFYLISQGGTFNGQTIAGIDAGDASLTKSAKLWLLVDQSLSSASDYADEGAVLDQSCQALLSGGAAGFTAADCTNVHKGTLATELSQTPTNNAQPADAQATCAPGTSPRELFDSETGTPATKFVAGSTWGRSGELAHSGTTSWASTEPATVGASSLTAATGVTLPEGQAAYLIFDRWHVLDYDSGGFYDALTVQIDDTGDALGPLAAESLTWVNGPTNTIDSGFSNPAAGRLGFGGDSRGYLASRADLSSYAGKTIKPQFTMNTDSSVSFVGLGLDDVVVYTCDPDLVNSSVPTITGTPQVGVTLSAAPGTWTPDVDPDYAYQWFRGSEEIPGATSADYEATAADLGAAIKVEVTATQVAYGPGSAFSAPTAAVAPGTLATGEPSITGTVVQGQTLSALPGSWSPAGVEFDYQWLRNGSDIGGATGSSYLLGVADVGQLIAVRVAGTKSGYTTASATSGETAAVVGANITAGTPTVVGTALQGRTLSASPGTWDPSGASFGYQWLRDGTEIAGATGASYLLGAPDARAVISVRVTGSVPGYADVSVTSAGTAPVVGLLKAGRPSVVGTAKVGKKLTARAGTWSPGPVKLTYTWLRNGKVIRGARAGKYTLTRADQGKRISVKVTGSRTGYQPASATSKATGKVKPKKR